MYFDRDNNGVKDVLDVAFQNARLFIPELNRYITTDNNGHYIILCNTAETLTVQLIEDNENILLTDTGLLLANDVFLAFLID